MKSIRFLFTVTITVFVLAAVSGIVIAQQQAAPKEPQKEGIKEEVTGWRIKDFKPYIKAIEELEKLSKEYSDNLLNLQ